MAEHTEMADMAEQPAAGGKMNEKTSLVPRGDCDPKLMARLHKAILIVSWISVLLIGALGITTLVYAIRDSSSASFAFSLDAFLDVLSSLVVIWRFTGDEGCLFSKRKESIACIVLGALFLFSALCIGVRSIYSLTEATHPVVEDIMFLICSINGAACTVLMLAKIYLGVKLNSKSILTDAVNSFIGALLAFSSIIGDVVYEHTTSAWMIDPIVGVVCSVLLVAYGTWIVWLSLGEYKEVNHSIQESENNK